MTTPELMAFVRKNPLLVGCGVVSIGLALAIYFRSDLINEANATLEQKTSEAHRYSLNVNNANQLKEQLAELTAANQAINARMIHPTDIGINQQYFYKLESETGVKLAEINKSVRAVGAKGPNFTPVMFHLSVQGNFRQIMSFLRALYSGDHFCRVLDASCGGGRQGPVNLTMTIELLGQS
jgi:hypothetical protein